MPQTDKPKLRGGALTIDLVAGGIYGDLDHCPKEDLMESAEALLSILPRVRHKGLWGLAKAYDADCYICTGAHYEPPKDIQLTAELSGSWADRPFKLIVFAGSSREQYWQRNWYEKVVGSVKDGHASPDTEGVPNRYRDIPRVPVTTPALKKKEPEVMRKLF